VLFILDLHFSLQPSALLVGAPGRSRTCDPRFRKPMLYPAELRAQPAAFESWCNLN
jgi:hypothetical protein